MSNHTTTSNTTLDQITSGASELFNYTSGRWIYNDALRRAERACPFNVPAFRHLAAKSVGQKVEDIIRFDKLAEGGFNRTFLVTFRDGFQMVGRIPYPMTQPKNLVIASEVATMDFLRLHGIPTPRVFDYSATSQNDAGVRYIFLEYVSGTNLGDIWFNLTPSSLSTLITKLVQLESRLFTIRLPASGSVYYSKDLPAQYRKVEIPVDSDQKHQFCIGPDTTLGLWYGQRSSLEIDRGPYTTPIEALSAGARKEIAYLTDFGTSLHPMQRLRREIYHYQKQSHLEHISNLNKYLQIAPYLVSPDDSASAPTIRHPDLQPNNVMISDELEVTGLIDWQNCAVLPRFLNIGIPNSFQNYGDSVSESLQMPVLPTNFDQMTENEQHEQIELFRRRQLHYLYINSTAAQNPSHYEAMTHNFSVLRRKLFHHASDPWEGDNMTLKADLIHAANNWSQLVGPNNGAHVHACPITFSEDEIRECQRLSAAQAEADEQLQVCKDLIGVGPEGWMPVNQYEESRRRERMLRADTLDGAESPGEKALIEAHWPFDDFDEADYM